MLLAGRYTLLEQAALDEFLPLCVEKDIGVMLGGPFNSGILATGARPGAKYNYQAAPADVVERVERIDAVCRQHNVPIAAAAIQFPLGHPKVASVIPGAVSSEEVKRNIDLMSATVPSALWEELRTQGLVRPDAPCPGSS